MGQCLLGKSSIILLQQITCTWSCPWEKQIDSKSVLAIWNACPGHFLFGVHFKNSLLVYIPFWFFSPVWQSERPLVENSFNSFVGWPSGSPLQNEFYSCRVAYILNHLVPHIYWIFSEIDLALFCIMYQQKSCINVIFVIKINHIVFSVWEITAPFCNLLVVFYACVFLSSFCKNCTEFWSWELFLPWPVLFPHLISEMIIEYCWVPATDLRASSAGICFTVTRTLYSFQSVGEGPAPQCWEVSLRGCTRDLASKPR